MTDGINTLLETPPTDGDPHDCICLTEGSMVATITGERPVQDLKPGDKVFTRDNGVQEIAWVGSKAIDAKTLEANPKLLPITIQAGALGKNVPEQDLSVSPNHRMLIVNDFTSLLFEERETLVAAKHLVGKKGVFVSNVEETTYYHIMFQSHEVILSNGAWSESFQPGDYSIGTLDKDQRDEIFKLFPELADKGAFANFASARRSLNKKEATLLNTI